MIFLSNNDSVVLKIGKAQNGYEIIYAFEKSNPILFLIKVVHSLACTIILNLFNVF